MLEGYADNRGFLGAVKELKLKVTIHNEGTLLVTMYPYCGNRA